MVEEIDTRAPASRLARVPSPNSAATWKPSPKVSPTSINATTPAVGMMRPSARRLNSRPSENISRMTPSSARVRIVSSCAKNGMGVCGPTMIPASR